MQTHLALKTLKGRKEPDSKVEVVFAIQPTRRAVLFIHGFNGNPITTWAQFHQLLPEQLESRGVDLYFYGYDALWAEMNASAGLFRDFLTRLFDDTAKRVNANLPTLMQRDTAFTYDQFVIVAHSLGAVIARRALVDATDIGAAWVNKVRLVLFAPAHMGASVAALAEEAAGAFPVALALRCGIAL